MLNRQNARRMFAMAALAAIGSLGSCVPPATAVPTIALAKGGPGPITSSFWYSVVLTNFTPGSTVSVTCHDSIDPFGFWTQTITIDASGTGGDSTLCYSADRPSHWVTGGGVQSNTVDW